MSFRLALSLSISGAAIEIFFLISPACALHISFIVASGLFFIAFVLLFTFFFQPFIIIIIIIIIIILLLLSLLLLLLSLLLLLPLLSLLLLLSVTIKKLNTVKTKTMAASQVKMQIS